MTTRLSTTLISSAAYLGKRSSAITTKPPSTRSTKSAPRLTLSGPPPVHRKLARSMGGSHAEIEPRNLVSKNYDRPARVVIGGHQQHISSGNLLQATAGFLRLRSR